jgi:hypothetical protein
MTLSSEQAAGYNKMIGQTTALTYVTDPNFDAVNGPCASTADLLKSVLPVTLSPKQLSMFPLCSGFAATPDLLFL